MEHRRKVDGIDMLIVSRNDTQIITQHDLKIRMCQDMIICIRGQCQQKYSTRIRKTSLCLSRFAPRNILWKLEAGILLCSLWKLCIGPCSAMSVYACRISSLCSMSLLQGHLESSWELPAQTHHMSQVTEL